MTAPLKVCIVGSGNWGSAIARIIGSNVQSMQKFASTIKMWVFEETVNGRKLTEVINTDHENVKYLPGYKLPENVVAVPELQEAAKDADLLVFVVPHQFIGRLCDQMVGCVSQRAVGISLIKGIERLKGETPTWERKRCCEGMKAVFGGPLSLGWLSPFSGLSCEKRPSPRIHAAQGEIIEENIIEVLEEC